VTEKTEALDWALFGRFSIPTNELATLSGGEETKYRLAQTLSSYQLGLLLDEPTTHLDQQGIQVLIEELSLPLYPDFNKKLEKRGHSSLEITIA